MKKRGRWGGRVGGEGSIEVGRGGNSKWGDGLICMLSDVMPFKGRELGRVI